MTNNDLVKKEIKVFIDKQEMFTSVDISNEIKKQGIWISNTETSNILKDLFNTDQIFDSYAFKRLILSDGKGTNVNAIVYYPSDQDPLNYKKFTTSITPIEFDIIKNNQKTVNINVSAVQNAAPNNATVKTKTTKTRKPKMIKKDIVNNDSVITNDTQINNTDFSINNDNKFSKSNRDYSKFNFIKIK